MLTILAIMAAIVVPKYASAAREAKTARLKTELQTIRRQIELYKLDHGGQIPDLLTGWTSLTEPHASDGMTVGPYLFEEPKNPLNDLSKVVAGDGTHPTYVPAGFVYDFAGGTGRIWGTESDSQSLLDESPAP